MGYDIHVTRKKDWSAESKRGAIKMDEWLSYAQCDESLTSCTDNGPCFFDWSGEEGGWFDLAPDSGCVYTKNPSEGALRKAHLIAAALEAKVQGDDGEVYLPNGETVNDAPEQVPVYPFWLLLLCLFSISCFIVTILSIML